MDVTGGSGASSACASGTSVAGSTEAAKARSDGEFISLLDSTPSNAENGHAGGAAFVRAQVLFPRCLNCNQENVAQVNFSRVCGPRPPCTAPSPSLQPGVSVVIDRPKLRARRSQVEATMRGRAGEVRKQRVAGILRPVSTFLFGRTPGDGRALDDGDEVSARSRDTLPSRSASFVFLS